MALPRLRVNASNEEKMVHPNHMIYQKMENLVQTMLDPENGVPIKTVKSFLSKVCEFSSFKTVHLFGSFLTNFSGTPNPTPSSVPWCCLLILIFVPMLLFPDSSRGYLRQYSDHHWYFCSLFEPPLTFSQIPFSVSGVLEFCKGGSRGSQTEVGNRYFSFLPPSFFFLWFHYVSLQRLSGVCL